MAVLNFAKKKGGKIKPKAKKKIIKKAIGRKPLKKKVTKAGAKKKAPSKAKVKKRVGINKSALPKIATIANEEFIGNVTHYFPKVRAAVVKISKGELNAGDKIHIKGHSSDFTQAVDSMQIEHSPINKAKPNDEIGLKVNSRVRINDNVYKVL